MRKVCYNGASKLFNFELLSFMKQLENFTKLTVKADFEEKRQNANNAFALLEPTQIVVLKFRYN